MPYGVSVLRDVRVKMRDGIELATDVYLPERDGQPVSDRFPALLVRTTYNKDAAQRSIDAGFFTRHGYVSVIQDVRGRYKSDGHYYHGIHEENDGYDTLEWIAQQPWSNGKVGMTGVSYLAAVQCAVACSGSPYLASMFHVKAPSDYYQNGFRHAGTLLMYSVPIAFMFASTGKEAQADPILAQNLMEAFGHGSEWLRRMPLKVGSTPLRGVPGDDRWLYDMSNQTDHDEFWKRCSLWQPVEFADEYADIPGYYVSGWYDLYREESFYTLLAGRKSSPIKLLMGPWTHLDFDSASGDVEFGPEAALSLEDYFALQLRWFDQTLKGKDSGIVEEPSVKIFVMGGGDGRKNAAGKMFHGGKWRQESEWPLARTAYTNYYFHANGTLDPTQPSEQQSSTTYLYDPRNPVPTVGGTSYFLKGKDPNTGRWILYVPYGAQDQRENPVYFGCQTHLPLTARHDVLSFQTPPLVEDVEVTGPLNVKLWASSSAVDTDFTAKLIDVHPPSQDYPDGYAMNLSDSIIRARYRDTFEKATLMQPGEIYEITIDLPPTSNLFQRGHCIRVDISSSNYPAFDPNPNTGDPYMTGRGDVAADNTIYHDAAHPSHIILPIIPLGA